MRKFLKMFTPARVASVLAGSGALASSLAPAIATADWQTTVGGVAGAVAVLGVLESFLKGQRAHEARQARAASSPSVHISSGTSNTGVGSVEVTGGTTAPVAEPAPVEIPPAAPAPPGDFTPPPAPPPAPPPVPSVPTITGG